MRDTHSNKEKLEKIAAILNLTRNPQSKQSTATMTLETNNTLSIEASYKRFLRPSLCQQSSFLNKSRPLSFEKTEGKPKVEESPARAMVLSSRPMEEVIPITSEFEG